MSKYCEPWSVISETPQGMCAISTARGMEIIRVLAGSKPETQYQHRITKCVNACAGMEDPEKEIQKLREHSKLLKEMLQGMADTEKVESEGDNKICGECKAFILDHDCDMTGHCGLKYIHKHITNIRYYTCVDAECWIDEALAERDTTNNQKQEEHTP